MDPARYPTENVQLERSDGYRGVPGVTTSVHYTTVAPGAPSDHVVWSICSFIHLNPCCLGLLALIFSIKARDRKVAGDVEGARSYGSTARSLNIAAMVMVSILILIVIITLSVVYSKVAAFSHAYGGGYGYGYRG
ncbi:dispanin subfamily A member 2b-like isoform X1 [Pseudoliparis swirei]|uniref:dispanin subfamily A member 2b-like isoform X1 n=1 Tax=Pseudoliparis swirei TaxID=2059687 RepID=UPI0024BDFE5B|nr:dispanin subfamily A member 2b-like isoform X1 [Pseudoliparis swirei]